MTRARFPENRVTRGYPTRRGILGAGFAVAAAPLALPALTEAADRLTSPTKAASIEGSNMHIIAVEEHITFAELVADFAPEILTTNGWPTAGALGFSAVVPDALKDGGEGRLAAMDSAGVTMQILSAPGP